MCMLRFVREAHIGHGIVVVCKPRVMWEGKDYQNNEHYAQDTIDAAVHDQYRQAVIFCRWRMTLA